MRAIKTQTAARNFLVGLLSLMVVASGWPVYLASDMNHNAGIDLQDVILSVRSLTNSANDPDGFMQNMENALTAMKILSGMKTVIKASKDGTTPQRAFSFFDNPYWISASHHGLFEIGYFRSCEQVQAYHSLDLEPASPPPKA